MKKIKLVKLVLFLLGFINKGKHVMSAEYITHYSLIFIEHVYCIIISLRLLLIYIAKNPKLGIINSTNRRFPQLIVSLTSYPARMKYIHITLFTLLSQDLKPDRVILWLAEDEFANKNIDNWKLRTLKEMGLTISWTPINTKSYKKLLPSLKKYPDACIITADDDIIYERWWIRKLYEGYLKTPTYIVGLRYVWLTKSSKHTFLPYNELREQSTIDFKNKQLQKLTLPSNNWLIETGAGALFPPQSFSNEVFNQKIFQKICPFSDDVWFSAMAMLHKTKKRAILNGKKPGYRVIKFTQETQGLFRINVYQNYNDIQMAKVFDYYNLYKLLD